MNGSTEIKDDVDYAEYRRLRDRVAFIARRSGQLQESEDFTHEILLQRYRGVGKHQTVDQSYIDALRRIGWGTRGGRSGYSGYVHSLDSCQDSKTFRSEIANTATNIPFSTDILSDFKVLIEGLPQILRVITILIYVWGFTEKEVGHCLGVSDSRVSQRLREVEKRIQQVIREAKAAGSPRSTKREIELETVLRKTKEQISQVECRTDQTMATAESRQMEVSHEESFDPWLT